MKSTKSILQRLLSLISLICMSIISLSGCSSLKIQKSFTKEYFGYFDTVSTFRIDSVDKKIFEDAANQLEMLLDKYDKLLDIYEPHDNTISLFDINSNSGKGAVKVNRELFDAIKFGIEMNDRTNGYCNIALGSVISLWHDARIHSLSNPESAYIPDAELISLALNHSDINSVVLNYGDLTVEITDPQVKIDFGALAKGYVGDLAADLLEKLGCDNFLLNLGGNVIARGKNLKNQFWRSAIQNPLPNGESKEQLVYSLDSQTLVTSGSYQRFYTVDEKKYSHIISVEDGFPPRYFASVSVIAPLHDSGLADALSTALFCMTFEDGISLISSIEGVDALWIMSDGSVCKSDKFGETR